MPEITDERIQVGKIYRIKRSVPEYFKVLSLGKRIIGEYVAMEHIGKCCVTLDSLAEEVKLIDIFDYWFTRKFMTLEASMSKQMEYLKTISTSVR